MKRIILIAIFILSIGAIEMKAKPPSVNASFGFFYSSLRSYGEWIEVDIDVYAWKPNHIARDWRPYADGRWSWTSHGWYWDSYEPFGWATYHYGRWYLDDYYGWIWIPDYEWGPAWVEWRYDDDYIGWAPLPPYAQFRINIGIHFSISWRSHYTYWNFVPYRRFCDHRMNFYIIDNLRSYAIFERTKYRTNYFMDRNRIVNGGIDRAFVERKAGYRIAQRDINEVNDYNSYEKSRSSRGEKIISYRPSERDMNSGKNIERYDFKKGERRTSIERDKIITSREGNVSTRRDSNRRTSETRNNDTRGNNRDREITRPEQIGKDNTVTNENRNSRTEIKRESRNNNSNDNTYIRKESESKSKEENISRERTRENNSPRIQEKRTERSSKSESRNVERRR